MRLFLGLIVFDMVFHSLAVLTPYQKWCKELGIARYPRRLPSVQEMTEDPKEAGDQQGHRVMDSLDSVWIFFKPWPSAETREKLDSWSDGAKFTLCWLTTRLGFLEELVGFKQKWTMFSPNVGDDDDVVRAKMVYADGSIRFVRTEADPEDLTHYGHWFKEKVLQYSTRLDQDWDARVGYCNLLRHRYPQSEGGAKLVRIYLIKVRIKYPKPQEEDEVERKMRSQNDLLGWRQLPPFFVYTPLEKNDYKAKRLK
jgi:hypothetical protein